MAESNDAPARKISPLMILPPLIFAAFAIMAYLGMQRGDTHTLPSTFIGQQAPGLPPETLEGFGGVTDADLAPHLKYVLVVAMLLGRLEFLALIAAVSPITWFGR